MTKRQESLTWWLERNRGQLPVELDVRTLSAREMNANRQEQDWLVDRWRQLDLTVKSGAATVGTPPTAPEPSTKEAPVPDESPVEPAAPAPPEPEPAPDDPPELEPERTLVVRGSGDPGTMEFELDSRRAKAYAMSGYWPDAKSIAQALVKIEAGRSLELPAIVAMSEIHVIDGKPTLGAGALAVLVKKSGRYDYRVVELTNDRCQIRFMDRGEVVGDSVFTLEDAQQAGLLDKAGKNWERYPRNMLFARAMSNGVAWFAPDVIGGRFYAAEEMQTVDEPQPVDDEVPV